MNEIKELIKNILDEKLENFELVDGGQQRTVGDLIENKVTELLFASDNILITEKRVARSRKSIEDVTLISGGKTFYIDPKTHNLDSDFSMPNLTSIQKLKKLFSSENEELIYVFVTYRVYDGVINIQDIKVFFVWELDMEILGIGALGKGQLQIKDAHNDFKFQDKGKTEWFNQFKTLVQEFLKKQLKKVNKQIVEWE